MSDERVSPSQRPQAVFLPDPTLPACGAIAVYDVGGEPVGAEAAARLGLPPGSSRLVRLARPGRDGRPRIAATPVIAVSLGDALPALLRPLPADASPSVQVWAAASRVARDLVAEGRVLPVLARGDGRVLARWSVDVGDAAVADALARLSAALPTAGAALALDGSPEGGRAAHDPVADGDGVEDRAADTRDRGEGTRDGVGDRVWRAGALVLAFLDAVADLAIRAGGDPPRAGRPRARLLPWTARWAEALVDPADPEVPLRDDADELVAGVDAWRTGTTVAEASGTAELDLTEPDDADAPWPLTFGVRADDGRLVPAADVWSTAPGAAEGPTALQQTLLRDLGRAARIFPPLEPALRAAAPEGLDLDITEAWALLTDGARRLADAGLVVVLPPALATSDLSLRLRVGVEDERGGSGEVDGAGGSGGIAGPDDAHDDADPLEELAPRAPGGLGGTSSGLFAGLLTGFRWEVALGGERLTEEEFAAIVAAKAPLVRVRDRWVRVDPQRVRRLGELPEPGELPLADALALGLAGSERADTDLLPGLGGAKDEVVDVVLTGRVEAYVNRLREVSERPPVPVTPDGFTGELRPYQSRGVAWLAGMGDLGLGAVLADDMGLGKCLTADTPVLVNGVVLTAAEVWERFAGPALPDDEGEWAPPRRPVHVNVLARGEDGEHMETARVSQLYRQWVDETVRTVRLDDGSEVTATRRHRFLTLEGWTNRLKPGDRVAVPERIVWDGDPVDPALVELLAWQIAEGYEHPSGRLVITQRDETVLVRLRTLFLDVCRGNGLTANLPTIERPDGRAAYLRINSTDYRRHLKAEFGYRWGQRSADKSVPDRIMASDDETLRRFLRGFFAAEGSVGTGQRVVEVSSASPVVMQQLSTMLRRFGVWLRSTVKHKRATNSRTPTVRPYRVGIIGGESLRRFHALVGIDDARKQALLDDVVSVAANSNTDGVPARDLLARARVTTGLPMSHFGIGNVYFQGTQDPSRDVARRAARSMLAMSSGSAERAFRERPTTRWTAATLAAYEQLDVGAVEDVRLALVERTEREVHYARVVAVEEQRYAGWVYDLEVPLHHNFVAGGMLCHNTVQFAAHVLALQPAEQPTLVVCPTSVVGNWERELGRFAPSLAVTRHHGAERSRDLSGVRGVVLTTYGTLRRDVDVLAAVEWDVVALDEAQQVKNPSTAAARAVRRLRARQRVALTGTPLENRLGELWALLDATNPGLLGSRARFGRRFVTPIEQHRDADVARRLRRLVAPFVLRREKGDPNVVADLPDKLERTVACALTPEQAALYQAAVDRVLGDGELRGASAIERRGRILALLTALKQVCNHPAQYLGERRDVRPHTRPPALTGRSGKLAAAREIVAEAVATGAQLLCFTQYVEMGHLLVRQFSEDLGCDVPFLHGGVPAARRDAIVATFQGEEPALAAAGVDTPPPVLVVSLRAGGTGLNLTAATHVLHYDRWWNPAVEDQATDRAHRIGQTETVTVHKLVTAGTVEERVAELLDRKRELAETVVGAGETWVTELGEAELGDLVALSADAPITDIDDEDLVAFGGPGGSVLEEAAS